MVATVLYIDTKSMNISPKMQLRVNLNIRKVKQNFNIAQIGGSIGHDTYLDNGLCRFTREIYTNPIQIYVSKFPQHMPQEM
jgi:hypothetical protein